MPAKLPSISTRDITHLSAAPSTSGSVQMSIMAVLICSNPFRIVSSLSVGSPSTLKKPSANASRIFSRYSKMGESFSLMPSNQSTTLESTGTSSNMSFGCVPDAPPPDESCFWSTSRSSNFANAPAAFFAAEPVLFKELLYES